MIKILSDEEIRLAGAHLGNPFDVKRAVAQAQNDYAMRQFFDILLAHKEYQRRWKGGMQILFGFSPDELNELRQALQTEVRK